MSQPLHVPVMMDEVLEMLPLAPGAVVVDGTLGLAGHAEAMGERIQPGGVLIGLDWDSRLLERAKARLAEHKGWTCRFFNVDYRELPRCLAESAAELGHKPEADAILLDLGVNNAHLETPEWGFTFREDGPLDMRMDSSRGDTAASLLNRASVQEIEDALFHYADERWARRIAQVIVERRKTQPLKRTSDLVDCVQAAIPAAKREKGRHPATKTMQGIRIWVNGELDDLTECLIAAAESLAPGGVMAVLTYHSGEARAMKQAVAQLKGQFEVLTKKPLVPSESEIERNPKSRSAQLRALKKTKENS